MRNKHFKKLVVAMLITAFSLSAVTGCKGGNNNSSSESPSSEDIGVYEPVELESNGNNIADYKIVISETAGKATKYAAECMQKYIKKATDVTLQVVTDGQSSEGKEIVIGQTKRTLDDNVDYTSLGVEGYQVKSVGDDLLIAANEGRGLSYGVYAYLEALGYRFYTENVENIPRASNVFIAQDVNISWNSTFDYREMIFEDRSNPDFSVRAGVNGDFLCADLKTYEKYGGFSGYIGGSAYLVHTLRYLIPENVYFAEHPEYYSYVAETGGYIASNPCLTNPDVSEIVYNSAIEIIATDPTANIMSISLNDDSRMCECTNCLESYEQYGKMGTVLCFVNEIAGRIKETYPDIWIDTLSYSQTAELPKGGVVPADNVQIRLCLAPCEYHVNSEDCERYQKAEDLLKGWSQICNRLSIYYYCINWSNLFAALPNYDAMYACVRMFAENNVKGLYCEGYAWETGEFAELKCYLLAKLMLNPYMTKAEYYYHMDDFLQGYYGDAGEYVKGYIDCTKDKIMSDIKTRGKELPFWFGVEENFLFDYDKSTKTYDMTFIDECNEFWDLAEEVSSDEILDRVKKSRIHWTYIELFSTMTERYKYGTEDEREELVERNKQLYQDIFKYGTIKKHERAEIARGIEVFEFSPQKW